jgi:nitric oxide reductase large subunit
MKKLWLIFIAIFVFSFAVLGWVGAEIFRQAPPLPREVVTTEGQLLIPAEEISQGKTSGRQWAEWKAARFGATALTLRPTGRQTICIAKHSSF